MFTNTVTYYIIFVSIVWQMKEDATHTSRPRHVIVFIVDNAMIPLYQTFNETKNTWNQDRSSRLREGRMCVLHSDVTRSAS